MTSELARQQRMRASQGREEEEEEEKWQPLALVSNFKKCCIEMSSTIVRLPSIIYEQ